MASTNKEVEMEILPFIRIYKDGSIDRPMNPPFEPPSWADQDPETGLFRGHHHFTALPISSPPISARLYLPKLDQTHLQELPTLVYFHGRGFLFESAFSNSHQQFLNNLVAQAQALAVSVEYRQAPEHLLPIAYKDCWAALQWVAINSTTGSNYKEPWLNHGDFKRLFIGGDSAGANIVHNMALRAGGESLPVNVKILGAFLTHPSAIQSTQCRGQRWTSPANASYKTVNNLIWNSVYPSYT